MPNALKARFKNWRANPRRWNLSYILSRLDAIQSVRRQADHEATSNIRLLNPPIDPDYIEVLCEPAFQRSLVQARDSTELDEARLANIWNMVRIAGTGTFLEVGSFRGGTALHICNAIDEFHADAKFYCVDPFEAGGFEQLDACDSAFKPTDFTYTSRDQVQKLLASKPNAEVIQGYFPAAVEALDLRNISFCHLDVDVYDATKNCLAYLAPRLSSRSLILLDDIGHVGIPGALKAANEFVTADPSFLFIPIFPSQALLIPKLLW